MTDAPDPRRFRIRPHEPAAKIDAHKLMPVKERDALMTDFFDTHHIADAAGNELVATELPDVPDPQD